MEYPSRVFLFGDQTVDPYPLIKDLSRQSTESLTLKSFFQSSSDAIRQELSHYRLSDRATFPPFDSILGLAEAYSREPKPDEAVSTVLLCICQLGLLLNRAGDDETIFDTKVSKTFLLGLCTGLLPAAALATTTSISQFLQVAPEIVKVSLRLGIEASRRSLQIERSSDSWAIAVSGIVPQEQYDILQRFHQKYDLSVSKKAYISAESESGTTISGPPSTLAALFAYSDILKNARKAKLPITAAFHARHLGSPNIDEIVGSLIGSREYLMRKDMELLHPSTGKPMAANNLGEALRLIVIETLHEPLIWPAVVQEMVSKLKGKSTVIFNVGPVRAADSLIRKMNAQGVKLLDNTEIQALGDSPSHNSSSDIAIVGFASRLPESETLEEAWETLEKGRDTHKKIPADRFDVNTHCDPSGQIKNTIITPYGCFLDRPGYFDARLFNMSPREAAQTDPGQRLLLLTTYEALEMAGYTPNGSPSFVGERMGTFFGQTLDDYREANASQDIEMYYVTGGIRAFGPGRLNYHFKWEGPSYCVDAACSSSALSIQMAVASLRSRECDTAVAGGTNVLTGSDMYSGLSRGSFLSPTGSCKTFDNDADGYCRGEGVGTVILKRLDDAILEGDNIQAVIKSAATNHSAYASSITHPHAGAQQKLMRQVLREAHLEPRDIDYVEMHGTGTQAGDATEFTSVTKVLSDRPSDNPLHVGAVKANVGHAEAAAGTNSLTKILMMMRKNAIPPHVGIKGRINEKFPPLDQVNVRINRTMVPFQARTGSNGKRRVLLNNFNATGGNTSLVIEDAPEVPDEGTDPRMAHVVALSGKTAYSLQENTKRLLQYIESNPAARIQDLAYTTTARRMHHVLRKAYAVTSIQDLTVSMKKEIASPSARGSASEAASAVFAFTGQGAQYVGMGQHIFKTSATFRKSIIECDEICTRQGLPSFKQVLTDDSVDIKELSPSRSQLALVSIAVALASLWQSWGITPSAVIGHSLGEYAALCVAGVLSLSDMLYLVGKRAAKMEEKCISNSHAMLAVQSGPELVQQTISTSRLQTCEIACYNGPVSTVVSGASEDIHSLEKKLSASGLKSTILELPFAFHSLQMDSIVDDIREIARNIQFARPLVPIVSTLLGSVIREEGTFTAEYLALQARRPVQFQGALEVCKLEGLATEQTLWIEMGAHPLCLGMVRSTLGLNPARALPSLKRDENSWLTLSKSIANAYDGGIEVSWTEYHRDFRGALRLLELPTYAFDLKNYWLDYKGDWLLTKGSSAKTTPQPQMASSFSTTCLQHVESESFTDDSASVSFTSQLGEPKLNMAVRGHLVNGIGLCPSSVYADVALTAAWYVASRLHPSTPIPAMDLSAMEVFRPLIVDAGETTQSLRVTASKEGKDGSVKVVISSKHNDKTQEHATCKVVYGDGHQWMQDWSRNAYLVQSRMESISGPGKAIKVHRLLKEMIYRQFQTVVNYNEQYHSINELHMDCELNEAVANIKFQPSAGIGEFKFSPYWLDTVAHLGGFILNASVHTPADTVFISHGWENFQIAAPLSDQKTYHGYVRMQEQGSRGVMAGDVYVFDGDEIVVLCKGLKFQKMKRTILNNLLGTTKDPMPASTSHAIAVNQKLQRTVAVTEAKVKPPTVDSHNSFSEILAIIAGEVGVNVSELTDGTKVSDLGVDSLLTISILGKLRMETKLDLPSSLFTSCPTFADLRAFFSDKLVSPQGQAYDIDSDDSSYGTGSATNTQQSSALSTPPEAEAPDAVAVLMSIIAHEVGLDATEILPSTPFAEIGVDSLLTISILDAFKTQIGMSLPAMFFQENPNPAAVQKAIGVPKPKSNPSAQPPNPPTRKLEPAQHAVRSKSVLLQGRQTPDKASLFLLPDGAGSLFSYIHLPSLPSSVAVYGLDSPFHDSPVDYTLSFSEVASIYINEIRSIQPKGPYMLGGWSLGGIHAYETCRQLIEQGETIISLIMIDSPCPGTLPPLPSPTLNLLEKAGIFDGLTSSGGPITERTRLHFLNSVRALEHYTVTPLPSTAKLGKVTVVWAHDGVLEGRDDAGTDILASEDDDRIADMNKAKEWLTGKRESFGPSGWDKLTGKEVQCHVVAGNHFSIMYPPKMSAVAAAVAQGLP